MSKDTLYIPKVLDVGYQNRKGTSTGKLAYVVYYDDKGKRRKEKSWKGWCREFIGEVPNTPTEGFVLNRGVGGARYSWGWNARNEYIRVFDPRGWEIEISVANLLFILQECTSTKGKGLEGKFVYSWDGTELVLLPVGCEEYTASTKFSKNQGKKVTKPDMKEGRMYRFKDNDEGIYLGRHVSAPERFDANKRPNMKPKHVFRITNPKYEHSSKYRFEVGFTKLAEILDDSPDYADELETFLKSIHCNGVKDIKWTTEKIDIEQVRYSQRTIQFNGSAINVNIHVTSEADIKQKIASRKGRTPGIWGHNRSYYHNFYSIDEVLAGEVTSLHINVASIESYNDLIQNRYSSERRIVIMFPHGDKKVEQLKFLKPLLILENNEEIEYE